MGLCNLPSVAKQTSLNCKSSPVKGGYGEFGFMVTT